MLAAAAMQRPSSLLAAFFALALAACGTGRQRSSEDEDEAHRRPPPPAPDAVQVIDADAPLDVRALRVEPELHLGKERVCDVLRAGEPQAIGARLGARYPVPVAARRLVRCGARAGEGWADLIFPPPSEGFVESAVSGKRLRVSVVAASGGFGDAPILAFVAVIGDVPVPPALEQDIESLHAGADFGALADRADLLGKESICAIAYAGAPEPIREAERARYPAGATHRLGLVCAHAAGDAWVDLVFTAERVEDMLALRRGARLPLRILALDGGKADLPIVTFARRPEGRAFGAAPTDGVQGRAASAAPMSAGTQS
jgi:hypothetical protein